MSTRIEHREYPMDTGLVVLRDVAATGPGLSRGAGRNAQGRRRPGESKCILRVVSVDAQALLADEL